MADDAGQWRRTTPLPARTEAQPLPGRQPSLSLSAEPGPERDWSSARGARFAPSATPPTPSGLRKESSGQGREREFREREFTPSVADEVNQWRSAKPLVEPTRGTSGGRELPPHQRPGVGSEQSSPRMADAESTVSADFNAGIFELTGCSGHAGRSYVHLYWRRLHCQLPTHPPMTANGDHQGRLLLSPRPAADKAVSTEKVSTSASSAL